MSTAIAKKILKAMLVASPELATAIKYSSEMLMLDEAEEVATPPAQRQSMVDLMTTEEDKQLLLAKKVGTTAWNRQEFHPIENAGYMFCRQNVGVLKTKLKSPAESHEWAKKAVEAKKAVKGYPKANDKVYSLPTGTFTTRQLFWAGCDKFILGQLPINGEIPAVGLTRRESVEARKAEFNKRRPQGAQKRAGTKANTGAQRGRPVN